MVNNKEYRKIGKGEEDISKHYIVYHPNGECVTTSCQLIPIYEHEKRGMWFE